MSGPELSIRAAAEERPNATALITPGLRLSFRELAERVSTFDASETAIVEAGNELDTAIAIYAQLEGGQPFALIQHSLPAEQRQALAAQMQHCSLDDGLVVFTSGSSGLPKGVQLPASALVASARASAQRLPWQSGDRWLCALPLAHVGGLSILLRCLIERQCAVLLPRFDVEQVLDTLGRDAITHISLVPTMLSRLLDAGLEATESLRVVLLGGAAAPAELVQRARARGLPVHLTYGMSECASQVITDDRPLDGVELEIRGGRLAVRGPMLMRGYLPPHPSGLDVGWFLTSDRAQRMPDGSIHILGRSDDLIISGGENVDPREVEAALRAHPAIQDCYVLGVDDQEWGQRVVALVVLAAGTSMPTGDELPSLTRHRRPKDLIAVDALPLLANGKVDKVAARHLASSGHR